MVGIRNAAGLIWHAGSNLGTHENAVFSEFVGTYGDIGGRSTGNTAVRSGVAAALLTEGQVERMKRGEERGREGREREGGREGMREEREDGLYSTQILAVELAQSPVSSPPTTPLPLQDLPSNPS